MVPEGKCHCFIPASCRTVIFVLISLVVFIPAVSATVFSLNSSNAEGFHNGLHYQGTDPFTLVIEDDITLTSPADAGIDSSAPLVITSPLNRTLTIVIKNNSDLLYGIKAPSILLESGNLDIHVSGMNNGETGNAFGIYAGSGNVTITGGSVSATVATTGHKNKGIYASRYVVISDGRITADPQGGSNTFGLDGGDVETGGTDGGIVITGGYISVNATGGANRNIGIDSKFGTVKISGDPVVYIHEDESAKRQNYVYNANITTISGGKAVVFTSAGGNYTLREDASLTRDAVLIPDRIFEVPADRSLSISAPAHLEQPAGTILHFGNGYGAFLYGTSVSGRNGGVLYTGRGQARQSPIPLAGLLAGLVLAVRCLRKD